MTSETGLFADHALSELSDGSDHQHLKSAGDHEMATEMSQE